MHEEGFPGWVPNLGELKKNRIFTEPATSGRDCWMKSLVNACLKSFGINAYITKGIRFHRDEKASLVDHEIVIFFDGCSGLEQPAFSSLIDVGLSLFRFFEILLV
jgi:hypothetical protein